MNATDRPMTQTDSGENRDTFMQRVRRGLGRSQTAAPSEAPPEVDESLARLASADDHLPDLFAERAGTNGMHVHRLAQQDAIGKVCELLRDASASRVASAAGATGQALNLDAALREAGFTLPEWEEAPGMSDAQYALDAGITDVHAALAETGTLVMCSGARHPRGLSLAPPTHIALVRASDLLPDMIDYWQRMKGMPNTELPSSQVFVTGPSKTADIEGELITGVHGPGQVHILLIEDA